MAYDTLTSKTVRVWNSPSTSFKWHLDLVFSYQQDNASGLTKVVIDKFTFTKDAHKTDYVSGAAQFGVRYGELESLNTNKFNNQNKNTLDIPVPFVFEHPCDDDGNVIVPLYIIDTVTSSSNQVPKEDWHLFEIELPKLDARGNIYKKVSGVWRKGTLYKKVNGSWRQCSKILKKVNGAWK